MGEAGHGRRRGVTLCCAAGLAVALIGLLSMALIRVSPPDAAFRQRVEAWRTMSPPPHPEPR